MAPDRRWSWARAGGAEIGKLRDASARARLQHSPARWPTSRPIVALLATADGNVDAAGRPLGTDFANVYAAGKLALAGEPAQAYDWPAHHDMQRRVSGREDIAYYRLALSAGLPAGRGGACGAALSRAPCSSTKLATLAAYLGCGACSIAGQPEAWLLALAFPRPCSSTSRTATTASSPRRCSAARSLVLDRRPVLAGVLIGCLAYKPQFGAAGTAGARRHRALARDRRRGGSERWRHSLGLTWAAFSSDVFAAFWHSLAMTRRVILEARPASTRSRACMRRCGCWACPAWRRQCGADAGSTLGVAAALVALCGARRRLSS